MFLISIEMKIYIYLVIVKEGSHAGWGKGGLTIVSIQNTEFILVLLFINVCIIFHVSNFKPALVSPCRMTGFFQEYQ